MVATGNDCHRSPSLIKKKNKKNLLLLKNGNHAMDPSSPTEIITDEDRHLARAALAECFRRQHPHSAPPRIFDDADVDRVAFCAAAIDGDAQSKLQALRDAIAGATRTSKRSPPTVRYIWGRIEHFVRHAERGRRMREAPGESTKSPPERTATSEVSSAPHAGPSSAQMEADLVKLFGPTWRARP
jgi:hypothetical protein